MQGLCGKPELRRQLARPRHKWENNIRINLQEFGVGVWTGSSWLRIGQVVCTCDCCNEPSDSINCGKFLD